MGDSYSDVRVSSTYGGSATELSDVVLVDHRCRLRMLLFRSRNVAFSTGDSMQLKDSKTVDTGASTKYEFYQNHKPDSAAPLFESVDQFLAKLDLGANGILFENGIFLHLTGDAPSDYIGVIYS